MIVHRVAAFVHVVARAPPRCGDPTHINWSWADTETATLGSVRRRSRIFEESLWDAELGPAARNQRASDQRTSVEPTITEDSEKETV